MLSVVASLLLLIPTVSAVAPGTPITLFPDGSVPGEIPGKIGPQFWHRGSVSNVTVPTLTPYMVPGAKAVVIVCPGGAYKWLSWDLEGTSAATWLNSIGVSAMILKYRVPSRPWLPFGGAPLMDAQRAVGVVRSRAADFGLNSSTQIGFLGFSAGSHLSAHISTDFTSRSYRRIDGADDASCRPDFTMLLYPWCVVGDNAESGSSCNSDTNHTMTLDVTDKVPPMFITQAEDDPVHVDNSILLFLALKHAKSPPSELHVYPKGGHGFGLCRTSLEVCTWTARAQQFLAALGLVTPSSVPQPGSASA